MHRVRIWDLPTRLFHWLLAICVAGSLVSVQLGGNAIAWHFRFGYAILALVLFRLIWGWVGPRYARFASFPPDPAAAIASLRGAPHDGAGHNPLGAFSVYALLAALTFQAASGLFANDSIMWDGPLKNLVSSETSDRITTLHRLNRFVLLGLIGLHLAAIAWHALRLRERLVRPMIDGDRRYPPGAPLPEPARDDARIRLVAAALLALCAAAVAALLVLGRPG
jgi:cytochrome b